MNALVEREELYEALLNNRRAYCATCLKIKTKQAQIIPLVANRAQLLLDQRLDEQLAETGRVRAITLKARQKGISTWVAGRFFHRAHLREEQSGLILAALKKQSEVLWNIYKRFADNLPAEIKLKQENTRHLQDLKLESGSSIRVETAEDENAARSMTLQMLHVSEMAFFQHPETVWTSVTSAIPADGTEIIIESTANGVGNFFHRFWEEAEEGRSSWAPIFLPWWIHDDYTVQATPDETDQIISAEDPWERHAQDDGISWEGRSWALIERLSTDEDLEATFEDGAFKLSINQIAWRRRMIRDQFLGDERKFRQEYPAEPDEAFLASGNQFLEEELLERLRKQAEPPKQRGNIIRVNTGKMFRRSELGDLRVWEEPDLDGHYVIGVDTASGRLSGPGEEVAADERGGRDFSCAQVIRLPYSDEKSWYRAKHVACLHGRMVPEVLAGVLWDLGMWYSCPRPGARTLRIPALIGVERNHSSGESVLRALDDGGYPELYVHRQLVKTVGKPTRFLGWSTDVSTRQPMLDDLAAALRMVDLETWDADLAREFRTFVRGGDYSKGIESGKPAAQEGTHDDRIMSLGIAWQMTRWHMGHGSAGPEPEFRPGKGPARG